MSEGLVRHLIGIVSMLIAMIIYAVGYISGTRGWWWTIITTAIIYVIVYKLVNAGGHH